jgi:hypothetical protein
MPSQSSKYRLTPAARQNLETQLEFVNRNRADYPGMVREVAKEVGCTVPNVYSVLNGATFNADIIRCAYSQLCRLKGMVNLANVAYSTALSDQDGKAMALVSQCQTLRSVMQESLQKREELEREILRNMRDLQIAEVSLDTTISLYYRELTDEVMILAKECLVDRVDIRKLPENAPFDTRGSEGIPPEVLKAIAMAKENGDISQDGFLIEEPILAGKFTPDGPQVDPLSPGRHVDVEGNEYFLGKD